MALYYCVLAIQTDSVMNLISSALNVYYSVLTVGKIVDKIVGTIVDKIVDKMLDNNPG